MGIVLFGYDVERQNEGGSEETRLFLRVAPALHRELQARCTFFVCGRTLEGNLDHLKRVKDEYGDLIDFGQHTYSHVLLKTVCQVNEQGTTVFRGGTLEQIEEEVARTNALLERHLGVECRALTGPYGYYRGLCDRPDLLEIVHRHGIRILRTYARNEHDWQPVAMTVQPFWYQAQGYGDVLECPVQGWQDCILRDNIGWANHQSYMEAVRPQLAQVAEQDLVWGYAQHDWSSVREDPEMSLTRSVLECALGLGLSFESYYQFHERQRRLPAPSGV